MRNWRLIGAVLTGAVLAVMMVGVVAAQSSQDPPNAFVGKVATILSLDEITVRDAFKQAAREIQDERLQARLSKAVERGKISKGQAGELLEWYQSRPEDLVKGHFLGKSHHGKYGKKLAGKVAAIDGLNEDTGKDAIKQATREIQGERLQAKLNKAVDRGKISQDQADELFEWYQARPNDLVKEHFLGKRHQGKHGKR